MFGCLKRLILLVVLVLLAAAAYFTRDRWAPPLMARISGRRTPSVARWEPVTSDGAKRAQLALDTLKRPAGAAYVNVNAGDLVALALEPVMSRLAPAERDADRPEARAENGLLRVRGRVKMSDLGGAAALGPLAGVLEGTQAIEVGGHIEVPKPGRAEFIVTRMSIGQLVLPTAALGRVVQQIAPRRSPSDPDVSIAITLPDAVADVRLRPGRITLYKAAP